MKYGDIEPIDKHIPAARQDAKRHYGVHPYFTRRPYNVVREYILRYTRPRDVVLDPFGGSGVTAIEAYLENRIGVQNDINPLANFIAEGLVRLPEVPEAEIASAYSEVEVRCVPVLKEIQKGRPRFHVLGGIRLPPDVALPKTADVSTYHELFTEKQLLSLAVLKNAIDRLDFSVRPPFLLAWSGALARLNKTFISANGRAESRGGSSIFSIYRYKVAKRPVELDTWSVFRSRIESILAARKEIADTIAIKKGTKGWFGQFRCLDRDVLDLEDEFAGKVDYIFTDPPYGGHISYIDLSTLWNVWLDIPPSEQAREKELIVGGEKGFSEERYIDRLHRSMVASFGMLKKKRWLSVVFQHWNIAYFKAILDAGRESGAELRAAVSQIGDPIWSMHKKKGKASVLAGEMILTFFKGEAARPSNVVKEGSKRLDGMLDEILASCGSTALFGENIFNRLVLDAWNRGVIDELTVTKEEFTALIEARGWHYDESAHIWRRGAEEEIARRWALA